MIMKKCSDWDDKELRCKNGFIRIHPVCWGGSVGCPTCGNNDSEPDCMKEELPSHLIPVKLRK